MTISLDGFVAKKTKIKLGTKDFTFTELSLADLCEFRAELVKERERLNRERRERLLEDAKKIDGLEPLDILKLTDTPITEEEVDAAMDTFDGLALMAYLSLRYAHIGIDREQVKKILNIGVMAEVTMAMMPGEQEKKTKQPVKRSKKRQQ